jgi:uncharacterized protein (DUF433 family)
MKPRVAASKLARAAEDTVKAALARSTLPVTLFFSPTTFAALAMLCAERDTTIPLLILALIKSAVMDRSSYNILNEDESGDRQFLAKQWEREKSTAKQASTVDSALVETINSGDLPDAEKDALRHIVDSAPTPQESAKKPRKKPYAKPALREASAADFVMAPPIAEAGPCVGSTTRVAVDTLRGYRALGWPDSRILTECPSLTQTDLDAAWAYAAREPDPA